MSVKQHIITVKNSNNLSHEKMLIAGCFTMEQFRRVIIRNVPEHQFMADAHLANVVGTARC